jgi:hypothetical protein
MLFFSLLFYRKIDPYEMPLILDVERLISGLHSKIPMVIAKEQADKRH